MIVARKRLVRVHRPRTVTILLPLIVLPFHPLSRRLLVKAVTRQRHVPCDVRVVEECHHLSRRDLYQSRQSNRWNLTPHSLLIAEFGAQG